MIVFLTRYGDAQSFLFQLFWQSLIAKLWLLIEVLIADCHYFHPIRYRSRVWSMGHVD
jgi:hypothetical protein